MAMSKREFLDYMIEEVSAIPVENIVGAVVQLVPSGQYYKGLCPFHLDTNLGSFIVTPQKGLWRCFAEGIGGTGIKFEMMYYHLSFLDAVFKLAIEYGIISEEEYRLYSRKRWNGDVIANYEKKATIVKEEPVRTAKKVVTHAVYNAIPRVCELQPEHKAHLINVRGLTEADLGDYFSFPSTRRFDLAGRVLKEVEATAKKAATSGKWKGDPDAFMREVREELPYVPGFYFDKTTGKVSFSSSRGIGFIVRNAAGQPEGISIRKDKVKDGEKRYIWFSSLWTHSIPEYSDGSSPSTPGGVIYPVNPKRTPAVCVTEGRFKAEQIAKRGNIALYVSGVSSWRKILPDLEVVLKKHPVTCVNLMFDADMMGNTAVYQHLKAISDTLQTRGISTRIVTWRISDGKGFDDLVLAHPGDYAKRLVYKSMDWFDSIYRYELETMLDEMGVWCNPDDSAMQLIGLVQNKLKTKEERAAFTERLQEQIEKQTFSGTN